MKYPVECGNIRGRPGGGFVCQIHRSRTIEDTQAAKNIEEFIRSLRNDNSGIPVT